MQINDLLKENYLILHQIHQYAHQIHKCKHKSRPLNQKWSDEEGQLMDYALTIFGVNYKALSNVVTSKSKDQVYQRIRYLKDKQRKKQDAQFQQE
ncbi:Homeobox-like_domain superfamily [Hexamita inflata]|uniref:Homeobox-like domain superfamily n=1 Tax=Hexamita inflata TaxID=28002 RepID=A0AA86P5B3_9EUKA|nr:Homeobox-like domain superfamily [Hexamita inflata]